MPPKGFQVTEANSAVGKEDFGGYKVLRARRCSGPIDCHDDALALQATQYNAAGTGCVPAELAKTYIEDGDPCH